MVRDAIVVGCGIVGATISKALTNLGLDVLTLDDCRPESGTTPSGGHLKPSWFGGMKRSEYELAMELLDRTWGLIEEEFIVRPTGLSTTVYRVDTDMVVKYKRVDACVSSLLVGEKYPLVRWRGGEERCRILVVAAGVWCGELLSGLTLTAKRGVSFRIGGNLSQPFIKPWAPYKQVVAHQQSEGDIWVGDGSAILPKNWTLARTSQCLSRCRSALGVEVTSLARALYGLRPYADAKGADPCLMRKVGPNSWVVTGAGKMGTIAAGWAANRLLQLYG